MYVSDIYGTLTLIMLPLGVRIVRLSKGKKIPHTWQRILDRRQKIRRQIIDIKVPVMTVWITDEIRMQPRPLIPSKQVDFPGRDHLIQRCQESERRKSTTDWELCVSIFLLAAGSVVAVYKIMK